MPACFTRHAAVWCSDFPPASRKRLASDHLPSASKLSRPGEEENPEEQQSTPNPRILQAKTFKAEMAP
jgi:hypothetical protein